MKSRKKLLEDSHLYVIIDKEICRPSFNIVSKIKKGGIDIVQFRNKISDKETVLKEAYAIRKLLKTEAVFIINDYLDVAKIVDCDGVHLGQDDPSIEIARKILGKDKIIGISCHNLEQAEAAQRRGADYISIGPIFPTPLKYKTQAIGLKIINKVYKIIKIPFFAVGGINEKNINKVLTCGAKRIAVCRAICQADNVERAIKNIKKYLVN